MTALPLLAGYSPSLAPESMQATALGDSLIAVFDNEHQLEEWWKSFQQAQGRVPKELAAGPAPKRGPRNKNKLKTKYLSRPIESPDPGKEPDQHGHWW